MHYVSITHQLINQQLITKRMMWLVVVKIIDNDINVNHVKHIQCKGVHTFSKVAQNKLKLCEVGFFEA